MVVEIVPIRQLAIMYLPRTMKMLEFIGIKIPYFKKGYPEEEGQQDQK